MRITSAHIIALIVFFTLNLFASSLMANDFVVVIDAGHGGKDGGAVGTYAKEKDITLNVAKLLGEKITNEFNDIKVVYTRSTDKYLTLQQRADIANNAKGNLFISIHVNSVDLNSAGRTKVEGASVFTLGLHKTSDNLEVAMRENSVIKMEDNYTSTYSGFDPNSSESYIIFEMNQNKHMSQSINLASMVQSELTTSANRIDKGVRQAGFWVLWATNMPSILIELDFICNPIQEAYLSSANGQEQLASSIYNAFCNYYNSQNNLNSTNKQQNRDTKKHVNNNLKMEDSTNSISNETTQNEDPKTINFASNDITYRIQILTSNKILEKGSTEFKGLYPIWRYFDNKLYKYTYEATSSLEDATKILRKVKNKFPQAFIVQFKNGKRIK